ncbi:uncharacterized protein [Ranitomeya imitator]|uniref:uncharacterized protein isoform X1 n=1 Tax=Ranitomeya imitator TaxID=111125 RepID=UPI0037E72137
MGWDAPAFYLTTVWLAATIKRQRHLRRILQKLGLKRRSDERSISTIFSAVKVELQHWSPAKGIRAMHRRIRDERKIQPCYRNDVNQAMKQFDATGLRMRTPGKCKIERKNYFSKGPNDVWHIDGNDKLKFYGIWVHLGIDGFSRRIIWLQAGTSNRKPGFIARYYLDAVIRENGCPQLVRADRGKENKLVALLQTSFRQRHCDSLAGINSFRYGKSVHNQRAECFNSYLKKSWICLWQERFEKMVGSDILDISNPVHIHCLQFSFLQLIQNELKLEAMEWNNHNIRKQRGVVGPFGKPELLYYSPPEGSNNQLQRVDKDLLEYATNYCGDADEPFQVGNKSFRWLCSTQLHGTTFEDRSTIQNATTCYIHLASYFMNKLKIMKADIPKNFSEANSIYTFIEQNLRV